MSAARVPPPPRKALHVIRFVLTFVRVAITVNSSIGKCEISVLPGLEFFPDRNLEMILYCVLEAC